MDMSKTVITQPIINSPFEEPKRHYLFDNHGITNTVHPGRRPSSYFVPIAKPRSSKPDGQQVIEDWTGDRIEENPTVIQIRAALQRWRRGRYTADTTRVTARLLEHWKSSERARRLFFCQVEAIETIIYATEVAKKSGDQ